MLHDAFAAVEEAFEDFRIAEYQICNWKHGELPDFIIQNHRGAVEAYQDSLIAALDEITQALKDIRRISKASSGVDAILKWHEEHDLEVKQGFVVTGVDGKAKIVDADGNTILE